MKVCPLSLELLQDGQDFRPASARALFGRPQLPTIDVEMAKLHTAGLAMVGKTSLSGAQRKLSLGMDSERMTLSVQAHGHRYVLKPPSENFPGLPANEHVTMVLAQRCGLDAPPCGLVPLADGELAYIVLRFDRPNTGQKLAMADFCQLSARMPADKYEGSAELCVRLLRRYASEPVIAIRDLFMQLLFAWWTGNGDLHLKNLSLLREADGVHRLSPVYDLLCTRLVIPNDPLALPIGGRHARLTAGTWRTFADYCQLPPRTTVRLAARLHGRLETACELIGRSWLLQDQKTAYVALLRERGEVLSALVHNSAT